MFKINKMTDYAIVCISFLSRTTNKYVNAQTISSSTGLSLFTVQKILKIIASKSDLLLTMRGSSGGYKLSKTVNEISIAQIVEMLDGPIKITSCVEGTNEICDCSALCLLEGNWNNVNKAIIKTLEGFSLADIINSNDILRINNKKTVNNFG